MSEALVPGGEIGRSNTSARNAHSLVRPKARCSAGPVEETGECVTQRKCMKSPPGRWGAMDQVYEPGKPVVLSDERLDAVLEILTAIEERVSRQKTRQE